jgi:hypothetical protein
VSERFLRMKREEPWKLHINREAGADGSASKTTPKKRTPKAKKNVDAGDENVDDDEDFETPSKKKTPLNKVKNGRVMKVKGDRSGSVIAIDDDEMVKDEYQTSFNGTENGYGYAVASNYNPATYNTQAFVQEQADDDEPYYDPEEAEA